MTSSGYSPVSPKLILHLVLQDFRILAQPADVVARTAFSRQRNTSLIHQTSDIIR